MEQSESAKCASNFKGVNISRAVYIFSGTTYLLLCLSLLISDVLLKNPAASALRKPFNKLADWLLFLFPNNLYLLLYGVMSNSFFSLTVVGVMHLLFFHSVVLYLQKQNSGKSIISLCVTYIIFSGVIYICANYLFFKFYFMNEYMRPG